MEEIAGDLLANDARFAVVVSRFNDVVTRRLLDGPLDTFRRHGTGEDNLAVVWVPGSFEIPVVADRLAKSKRYAAVVCLGAVIAGETDHHDYINHAVANAIMQIGRKTGVPVTFGILTCSNLDQALNRAGGKFGNKGCEAALAAIEMVSVLRKLKQKFKNAGG
ncbi:MAG: 6,7-dimethyl-8-ribityllumazine synthase [Planctomycetes bacterium]|nr:6,7-dimethyl-8-ribityllumazine synthase [Planctomycetota bacterium]